MLYFLKVVLGSWIIQVNEESPYSSCSSGFTGFETDIVRDSLATMQQRYLEDYTFVCSSTSTEVPDAIFGRLGISSAKQIEGYQYSVPIYRGELGLMIKKGMDKSGLDVILLFSVQLWSLIAAVLVSMGILVYVYDADTKYIPRGIFKGTFEGIWLIFQAFFSNEIRKTRRIATRNILFFLCFTSFVTISFFYAITIDKLFLSRQTIKSFDQINGKVISTHGFFKLFIAQFQPIIQTTDVNQSNYQQVFDKLIDEEIDGIILEYDLLQYMAEEFGSCDVLIIRNSQMVISRYVQIHPEADKQLIDTLNQGITKLSENGVTDHLRINYFDTGGNCDYETETNDQILFFKFGTLWVIWTSCVIAAFTIGIFIRKGEVVRAKTRHSSEIRRLQTRPETKILLPTQTMVRNNDINAYRLLGNMERFMRRQNIMMDKVNFTTGRISAMMGEFIKQK